MTTKQLGPLVQYLHSFASPPLSDEELLRAFVRLRDESAFAAIVRRYGGLVLGVCRRALRHEQDAEDAFQATFLVLARNASSIRDGNALAGWLHGVSHRIALKARHDTTRRKGLVEQVVRDDSRPPADELSWREVQQTLDEEVARLPEIYRLPFVLCCLEGLGRAEAASRLGIKDGTLSSRLAQSRKRLQQALARRGLGLVAVPVCTVPHALARQAVWSALRAGHAGPAVLDLAGGATATATTGKLAGVLVLAAALLACAAGLLLQQPGAAAQKPAATRADTPKPAAGAKKEDPATVQVRGRVLRPDGKPAAGAALFVQTGAGDKGLDKPRATAGKDGRFRFNVDARLLQQDAKVIATAKGFAPVCDDLGARAAGREIALKLGTDDVPLTGRLISLEGAPLEGVTVEVMWVGAPRDRTTAEWVDHFVERHSKGWWINEDHLRIVRPQALGLPRSATTDRDGRFRIDGIGRDRVVTLMLRSEKTVAARLQVALRPGPQPAWVKGDHGLYSPGFTFLLAPTKPIVGTVRDRKTGKPIAGILVAHSNYHARTTTNEKGEYRIIGAPKQKNYMISLGGKKGVPYLDYTVHDIADTPGLDPLRVDFQLERGVEISGRVLDKVTGKPVRGSVSYFIGGDNPNVKDFVTLGGPKFIVSNWGRIAPDGSFTVLGIPGPGALVVRARDSTRYVRIDSGAELRKIKTNSFPIGATHGFIRVDPSEKDPKSLTYTVQLTPAGTRPGRVLDPDGKALSGAHVAGLTDDTTPTKLTSEKLTMTGLHKGGQRAIVVLHEKRKLGAVAALKGDTDRPFEVKLQPLGTLTGRLVDADGKPLPGRKVLLFLWLDARKFENLPQEWCRFDSLISTAWREFTTREGKTDKDGRFRIEGLVPGQRYDLNAGEPPLDRRESPTHRYRDFRVEPGKVKDTGDLKPQARPG